MVLDNGQGTLPLQNGRLDLELQQHLEQLLGLGLGLRLGLGLFEHWAKVKI